MFVVILGYVKPLDQVDHWLNEHVAFLDECYSAGLFIASGRRVPRTGGVILATGDDRDLLDRTLQRDPFKREGVAEYAIYQFQATKMQAGLETFFK